MNEPGRPQRIPHADVRDERFLARAPAEVVEEQRERRAEASDTKARLGAALARLSA